MATTSPAPIPSCPRSFPPPCSRSRANSSPSPAACRATVPGNSFVSIPSLKAVVAGDTVFDRVYFGVPKDKAREDWMKTLDQIEALKPAVLIPGHEGPGAKHDLSAIVFMKKYIADWYKNVAASKNAAEMKAKVLKQYPGLGMEFTLNDRVAAFFPDPSKAK